jgi:glycosyltransferase involved in cell wall biosynthesis
MRILIATDAFPPASGGSGWSTYELARGLRSRGHEIVVVQPCPEPAPRPRAYDGFQLVAFPAPAPSVPFVRNYFRNERLYGRLAACLADLVRRERIDLIHAQHVLTGPAVVRAARACRIPSICTVRDYWPVCYWGDLIVRADPHEICPGCSASRMTRCLRPHAGAVWPLGLPFIPYMRANLRLKRRDLCGAAAIVAVSRRIAADLRERAPELSGVRIETIPNALDIAAVRTAVGESTRPLAEPYALFVGKLEPNKGITALVEVAREARLDIPIVVVGDGSARGALSDAAARAGCDVRLIGWQDREVVFRWLRHARFLIFPSSGPESLSRVLIEASALGVPIAAMNTGGTSDILTDEETALLSLSVAELAADVARLAADSALRDRLGAAAARFAATHFDLPVVLGRMERLYEDVVERSRLGT